jgi:predicted nucleic acid-binding protein
VNAAAATDGAGGAAAGRPAAQDEAHRRDCHDGRAQHPSRRAGTLPHACIAATALERSLTLYTRNLRDLQMISSLLLARPY